MKKIKFKMQLSGFITDSEGHSVTFTEKNVKHIDVEFGNKQRLPRCKCEKCLKIKRVCQRPKIGHLNN